MSEAQIKLDSEFLVLTYYYLEKRNVKESSTLRLLIKPLKTSAFQNYKLNYIIDSVQLVCNNGSIE